MKQDNELLTCPFCGSDARAKHHDRCYFAVLEALKKSRQADLSWAPGLLAAWNRRAPDARDARIAELEAELAAEPRATDAPTAVAAADPQLLKFYGAHSDEELIKAQAAHIERLQAKLPPAPSFAPQRVREG